MISTIVSLWENGGEGYFQAPQRSCKGLVHVESSVDHWQRSLWLFTSESSSCDANATVMPTFTFFQLQETVPSLCKASRGFPDSSKIPAEPDNSPQHIPAGVRSHHCQINKYMCFWKTWFWLPEVF